MATINGTAGNDDGYSNPALVGSVGDDVIHGLAGSDNLAGGDGADALYGDEGDDRLDGGLGNDTLYGGIGNDVLSEDYGTNALYGQDGNDSLYSYSAGTGQILDGGNGADRLYLIGGQGQLSGGGGADLIQVITSNNTLSGGTESDTFQFSAYTSNNVITDFTSGASGDLLDVSYLLSNGVTNYAGGNPFADGHLRLVQNGSDTLVQIDRDGSANGAVFTTLVVLNNVTTTALTDFNFGGYAPNGSLPAGQFITGTSTDDNGYGGLPPLVGTIGADVIHGMQGNDILEGGDGADVLYGDGGDDRLNGGLGNDTLYGGDNDDVLSEDYGTNALYGQDGNDSLYSYSAGTGQILDGGNGADRLYLIGGQGQLSGGGGADLIQVITSNNTLSGGTESDTFQFSAYTSNNVITDFTSGASGDLLDVSYLLSNGVTNYAGGNPFADGHLRLVQSGSDTLVQIDRDGSANGAVFTTLVVLNNVTTAALTAFNFGGYAQDGTPTSGQLINGTAGNDDGYSNPALVGSVGDDVIHGLAGSDNLAGGDGADALYGDEGDDRLDGGLGNDTLYGGIGNDVLSEDYGTNALYGQDGNDSLYSYSAGTGQILDGGNGADRLYLIGGQGQLSGGGGADLIQVITSNNTLSGGTESDTFQFSAYTSNNVITDFTSGASGDLLDVSYLLSNGVTNYAGGNPFADGHLRLVQNGSDTLVQIDRDGSANGAVFTTLVQLANVTKTALTAFNFGGYALNGSTPVTATVNAPQTLVEGETGTISLTLLNVSQWAGSVSVSYSAVGSTAINGSDIDVPNLSGSYSISRSPAGSYTLQLTNITALFDQLPEAPERVFITVSASGQVFSSGSDTITIAVDILEGGINWAGTPNADVFVGGTAADHLAGLAGDDTLSGAGGADVLTGGTGNDTFRDSAAGLSGDTITDFGLGDRIVITDATVGGFTFSVSGHTLNYSGGSLTLTDLPIGRIVASAATGGGVQLTIERDVVSNDFNGDGRSDILFRDSNNGLLFNWLGSGNGSFVSNTGNFATTISTEWRIAGTGDFNGDGRTDILWRQDVTGHLLDWLGNASGGFNTNPQNFDSAIPANIKVVGTGDFNGDGRDDILFRDNNNGLLFNWLGQANGGFVSNTGNFATAISNEWRVIGTGDFNGDGRDDILWRQDGTGHLLDWLGNASGGFNTNAASFDSAMPFNVAFAGTGDFNGDGRDDILWRGNDGLLFNWLGQANGGFVSNTGNFATAISNEWRVVSVGDFNADGRDDILWRQDGTGHLLDWLGNASGGFNTNPQNFDSSIPTNLVVQDPFL